ncbi:hypothetical protein EAO76_05530 [Streptomyces sp. sk2.1]|nr:hypothetical protein EAO76_05530 [Streptomyces sp. sk2.1]
MRGPRRHFVHSKVMAWVAVDRTIKLIESGDPDLEQTWATTHRRARAPRDPSARWSEPTGWDRG